MAADRSAWHPPNAGPVMRVGIVGCGRVAERGYLPALRRTPAAELVAVADTEPGRCRALAPSLPAYPTAAALVGGAALDLLVVATPADSHLESARAASEAGVAALVEKPPGRNAADAVALARLEPAPWIGFNRRFEPRLAELRDRLSRASAPSLELTLSIDRSAWGAHTGSDDVVLDLGSHAVDLLTWLAGRTPERVRGTRPRPLSVGIELTMDDATARAVIAHDRPWAERLDTRDDRGVPVGSFRAGGRLGRLQARLGVAPFATLPDLLAAEIEAIVGFLSRGSATSPLATAVDGVGTMAVLDALRASLDSGGDWVVPELGLAREGSGPHSAVESCSP